MSTMVEATIFQRNICRTCLRKISASESVGIFSDEQFYQGQTLNQVFKEITQTLVDSKEMLPVNVCLTCAEKLKRTVSFKRSIEEADRTLRFKLRLVQMRNHTRKADSLTSALNALCDELNEIRDEYETSINKNITDEPPNISPKAATCKIKQKPVNVKQLKVWQKNIDGILSQKTPPLSTKNSALKVSNKNLNPLKEITPNTNSRNSLIRMSTSHRKNDNKYTNPEKNKSEHVQKSSKFVDDKPTLDQQPGIGVDPLAVPALSKVYSNKRNSPKENDISISDIIDSATSDTLFIINEAENLEISEVVEIVETEPTVVEISDEEEETNVIAKQTQKSEKSNNDLKKEKNLTVAIVSSLEKPNPDKDQCSTTKEQRLPEEKRSWINNKSNTSQNPQTEPKKFSCSKCDKKFSNPDFLERHLLYHSLNLEPTDEGAKQNVCPGYRKPDVTSSACSTNNDNLQKPSVKNPPAILHLIEQNLRKAFSSYSKVPPINSKDHNYNSATPSSQELNESVDVIEECKYCKKSVYRIHHHGHIAREHRKLYKKELKSFRKLYYKCDECPPAYSDIPTMLMHMAVEHPPKFRCSDCDKIFTGSSALNAHMRRLHLPPTPTVSLCFICGKLLKTACLSVHIKGHKRKRTIKCPIGNCSALMKYDSSLKGHLKSCHSDEKQFVCERCGKQFAYRKYLRRHMHTHSDTQPYKCVICERAFVLQSRLKTHLKSHQHNKPYTCPLCPQTFGHKQSIKKHCIRYHPEHELAQRKPPSVRPTCITKIKNENRFECKICQRKFAYEYNLKKHNRTFHPMVYFNLKKKQLNNGSTIEEIIDQEKKYFSKFLN